MDEIGSTLREARMRARIDITEVEASTKIRAKYLRAIENEEWDLLPGPVYTKSFLRTYGDYLGLDSRMLIDDYKRRYERPSDSELRPISPARRDRPAGPKGPVLPPWAVVAGVVLALLVVLYFVGRNNNKSTPTTGAHATTTHHKHNATTTHTAATTTAAPPPRTVKLELVPTSAVYVCLVNGAGNKLIPGKIFNAGDTIPSESASKLLLTLGNAGVQMKVNGQDVPVAASASSIGYLLTARGHRLLPASKQPTCR
jgi:cytoskeletal protein RodZ